MPVPVKLYNGPRTGTVYGTAQFKTFPLFRQIFIEGPVPLPFIGTGTVFIEKCKYAPGTYYTGYR
jgi:hypothetical protein